MADTKRALENISPTSVDLDLVETLLTSRSNADAVFAYSMLRQVLPSRGLVMLANLREVIAELPEPPFATGTGLDALARAGGYEATGRSYRKLLESDLGTFGLEFVGGGTLCQGIVVHTTSSRFTLRGDERCAIDHEILRVLMTHANLLDAVLEGLQVLGYVLEPRIYVTPEDFITENGASAAGEMLGDLF